MENSRLEIAGEKLGAHITTEFERRAFRPTYVARMTFLRILAQRAAITISTASSNGKWLSSSNHTEIFQWISTSHFLGDIEGFTYRQRVLRNEVGNTLILDSGFPAKSGAIRMPLIELHAAQRDELETIENLMQFYVYDFSEWLPLKLGEHGFFNIQPKPDYWRNPATRPFLIKVDGELAGFVSVDDDTHIEGAELNIGYFLVARRFRGQGVAKFVVSTLLSQLPGQWQIFHMDANLPARRFWANVMPDLTGNQFTQHQRPVDGYPCTFYCFHCPPPSP